MEFKQGADFIKDNKRNGGEVMIESNTKKNMDKLVEQAKLKVIRDYEDKEITDRKWLESKLDSYGSDYYRIQIFVLEGSPKKGVVIADYGSHLVMGFNSGWKKIFNKRISSIL